MKLPQLLKIREEDIPNAPSWMFKIIRPLNLFMEQVWSTLNKRVDADNLAEQIYEQTVKTTDFPLEINLEIKTKPVEVRVMQILKESASFASIASAVFLEWVQENPSTVTVKDIIGISAATNYKLRLCIR